MILLEQVVQKATIESREIRWHLAESWKTLIFFLLILEGKIATIFFLNGLDLMKGKIKETISNRQERLQVNKKWWSHSGSKRGGKSRKGHRRFETGPRDLHTAKF